MGKELWGSLDAITLELYGYKSAIKYKIHFLQSHGNHINNRFSAGKPYNLPVSIATGIYLHINVSIGFFDAGKIIVYICFYQSITALSVSMANICSEFKLILDKLQIQHVMRYWFGNKEFINTDVQ